MQLTNIEKATPNTLALLQDGFLLESLLNIGAGYDAHVVGGVLRAAVLGGETNDVDIAVLVEDYQEYANLHADVTRIVLPKLGYNFELKHNSGGYSNDGFMGDFRSVDGRINIIAYDKQYYSDVFELISKFDLNINQWYVDNNVVKNEEFDHVVRVNPYRDGQSKMHDIARIMERGERFAKMYPELDWSEFNTWVESKLL